MLQLTALGKPFKYSILRIEEFPCSTLVVHCTLQIVRQLYTLERKMVNVVMSFLLGKII